MMIQQIWPVMFLYAVAVCPLCVSGEAAMLPKLRHSLRINETTDYDAIGLGPLDATWILFCTFLIFTMQSGFGLLESGIVSSKNRVNILYKNASDLTIGGTIYWLFGYGLAFGNGKGANGFCGSGSWALSDVKVIHRGDTHTMFIFQISFATTAATIVSGAVAERIRLHSYLVQIACNTFTYAFVSHWIWDTNGWLYKLGVVDIAGAGAVHLCGGTAAFISAAMLGPRSGRYEGGITRQPVGDGLNVFLGTFFLWWGWLAFNTGSIYGVDEGKWASVALASSCTILGSLGGGLVGIFNSVIRSKGQKFYITDFTTGVLGGLISTTGACALIQPWEAFVIGAIGALIVLYSVTFIDYLKVDDPVGAAAVHGIGGIWGMVVVGLFMNNDPINNLNRDSTGIFHKGRASVLGLQLLAVLTVLLFTAVLTFTAVYILSHSPLGYRLDHERELHGADLTEHGIGLRHDLTLQKHLTSAEIFRLEHSPSYNPAVAELTGQLYENDNRGDLSSSFGFVRVASHGAEKGAKISRELMEWSRRSGEDSHESAGNDKSRSRKLAEHHEKRLAVEPTLEQESNPKEVAETEQNQAEGGANLARWETEVLRLTTDRPPPAGLSTEQPDVGVGRSSRYNTSQAVATSPPDHMSKIFH